jgi:hypothetical protein
MTLDVLINSTAYIPEVINNDFNGENISTYIPPVHINDTLPVVNITNSR